MYLRLLHDQTSLSPSGPANLESPEPYSLFEPPILAASLSLGLSVRDGDRRSDPSPCSPTAFQSRRSRRGDFQKVIKNTIRDVFVENPFVAELLQVQLQTLELHALLIRHVLKYQRPKIRLPSLWTDRCELGTDYLNRVIAIWIGVVETFKFTDKGCSWHSLVFHWLNDCDASSLVELPGEKRINYSRENSRRRAARVSFRLLPQTQPLAYLNRLEKIQ